MQKPSRDINAISNTYYEVSRFIFYQVQFTISPSNFNTKLIEKIKLLTTETDSLAKLRSLLHENESCSKTQLGGGGGVKRDKKNTNHLVSYCNVLCWKKKETAADRH
jgi:hypothetical protein